jgi:hypothetical protein
MTASAVFILDMKGKVIISRNYRGDVPMNCVERFSGHVLEAEEADERPVWLEHGACADGCAMLLWRDAGQAHAVAAGAAGEWAVAVARHDLAAQPLVRMHLCGWLAL